MADPTTDQDTQQPPGWFPGGLGVNYSPAPSSAPTAPPAPAAAPAPASSAPAPPAAPPPPTPSAPAPGGPAAGVPGAQQGFPMGGGMNNILRQLPKPPQLRVPKLMPPD